SPSATEMATPRSITTGEFATGNMQWSADGSQILFVSNRQRDAYYQPADSDLYAVSKEGGEPARIATIDGNIGAYAIAPDGKRIAFVGTAHGNPVRSYSQPDLWVLDAPGGTPRHLTSSLA